MTIDLTQFHDAFFEESFEALDSMEAALLKLDVGAPEPELINTIFRVAHSIKGGSATFGFSDVASFTHSLETLLDELRSGGMQVTLPMSDLLLKSGLAKLLDAADSVTLDISAVQRIDTAGLQVIAAFIRERESQGREVQWRGQAPALETAARLLGLGTLLKLPTAEGETAQ